MDEIVQKSHVTVAEDFTVKAPEMPQGLPPGMEVGRAGRRTQPAAPPEAEAAEVRPAP